MNKIPDNIPQILSGIFDILDKYFPSIYPAVKKINWKTEINTENIILLEMNVVALTQTQIESNESEIPRAIDSFQSIVWDWSLSKEVEVFGHEVKIIYIPIIINNKIPANFDNVSGKKENKISPKKKEMEEMTKESKNMIIFENFSILIFLIP